MRTSYDVIVVGAGSMGMSAGYYLARQGIKTLLLDAFDPPHTSGSHHGETRLMRHAYTGSSVYTEMALRADRLWTELEQETGETLLVRSGVLNMGPPEHSGLGEKRESAEQYRIPVEALDADEIRKRWPGIQPPDSVLGLYEPQAGYLRSEACIRAYRQLAEIHGAVLLPNTPAVGIAANPKHKHVSVTTHAGTFAAEQVIVSTGAWFGMLSPSLSLPIQPVRKAVAWFAAEDPLFEPLFDQSRFPGFTFGGENGGYYGFPSLYGSGVKIGRHDSGQRWQPGEPFQPFGFYPEDEEDLRQALLSMMPKAAGKLLKGAVCKYELTPDEHFIIDRHPEHDSVWLAGGFSGHGFKFSSAVGEILADLVTKQKTAADLSPFAITRFAKA